MFQETDFKQNLYTDLEGGDSKCRFNSEITFSQEAGTGRNHETDGHSPKHALSYSPKHVFHAPIMGLFCKSILILSFLEG